MQYTTERGKIGYNFITDAGFYTLRRIMSAPAANLAGALHMRRTACTHIIPRHCHYSDLSFNLDFASVLQLRKLIP